MTGRRRGHGEGAVYQRATDGLWVASLNLGFINGKRRRKVSYAKTQREAIANLNALKRAQEQGQDLTKPSSTLSTWLDQWHTNKTADGLRPATLRSYRWLIDTHIVPTLGEVRLDRLTPADIRALITRKSQSGLAPASVAHILRLLRNALGEAERLDLVPRNVARAVRMPSVPKFEASALDADQARNLLTTLRGNRLQALFSVTLVLGLRRGEVLGLTWPDVDFDSNTIHVRKSLQRVDGGLQLVPTKTRSSNALIPAPPSLMKILSIHRTQQQRERLALGTRWPGNDFVFTSSTGTPIDPRNIDRVWKDLREEAGLPPLRFHDLRHSCATILAELGVHPRVAMEMLRHSQISMTMDTYTHVASAMQRDAAANLESALFM